MNPLYAAVLAFLIQNHVVAFTIYAKGTDSEEIQNLLPLVRGLGPALPTSNDVPDDKDAVALALEFGNFKARFNKKYASAEEEDYRYMTFKKNIAIARTIQSLEQGTAKYGVTKFSDLTGEEFASYYLTPTSYWVADPELPKAAIPDGDIPASVDWRTNGAVTEVKNQGQCGSCWAFSTTGNIEGQWFLKRGALISLSEQELVSCDKLDEGCSGGLPSNAYKAVMQLGGLETESKYPYTAKNSKCSFEASATAAYINSSVSISSNETEMAAWLAQNGPISIGINAAVMQFYFGGISHPWKIFCSPSNLDHGVLIVGYGTENSTPYWIVKNSWGEDWGEKGYYRVYRGDGTCGLNTMCTSAVVD